jgi:hypothetical protein
MIIRASDSIAPFVKCFDTVTGIEVRAIVEVDTDTGKAKYYPRNVKGEFIRTSDGSFLILDYPNPIRVEIPDGH